jgi:uncharacterized protein (TIGR02270 family)
MPRIRDIQVEHLDEAEFLLEMHTNCIDSPKYTLSKLREGPEERFLARVDGLLIGGDETLEHLLFPVLDAPDDDEFRTAAAAFTILEGAGLDACQRVLSALEHCEEPDGLRGLARALGLTRRAGLVPWIGRDLEHSSGPALVGRLRALAHHRVDAGPRLLLWLDDGDLQVRCAAVCLARHTSALEVLRRLGPIAASDDPELRWTAIESGLIRGLPGMWELACREAVATQPSAHQRAALSWVAMLGDHTVHQRLLANPPTADLLWASGLTGRVTAVDQAMSLLEHESLARLAGEVVCTIAGLSHTNDHHWLDNGIVPVGDDPDAALPPLERDDLDANLAPRGDALLRLPNPETVRVWWSTERSRFDAKLRYSSGQPFDGVRLQRDLRELPMRVRHARALELAARTAGEARIETHALTMVQAAQLDSVASHFARVDCQRGHPLT